jgi:alkylhydroperoxidase family enzyme
MSQSTGSGRSPDAGFLDDPEPTADVRRMYDDDVEQRGYVMNLSRVWAHQPVLNQGISDLMGRAAGAASLTLRQRGILITACASALGDSYCSLAWGNKLAGEAGAEVAAGVLQETDAGLDASECALARWARKVARDPNATGAGDVQALRDAGHDDAQIAAITIFIALRIAFSTVNDALGARPDAALVETGPPLVSGAVTFGRPVGGADG